MSASKRQQGSAERWKMALTLGVTLLVAYYDRLNISLALPLIAVEQGWTAAETASKGALLMGLFYAGYGLANILLSPLSARIGPRRSLLSIILLWSLFTALGAVISQYLMLFMASRVLLGLSEGIHFPMMNLLTRTWFAPRERSRANGIWIAGLFLAVLTAPILLVPIMDAYGWRSGFHLLAAAGLLLSLPLVSRYVYDRPAQHPRIDADMATALAQAAEPEAAAALPDRPLLRSSVFQQLLLAGILNNMFALGIAAWLPTYLGGLEGVVYGDLAHLAALPYAASLAGISAWALLGDRFNRRALLASAGYLGAGLAVMAALRAGNAGLIGVTVGLFSLGVFCVAAYTAAEFALLQKTLSAARVATGVGLYNGLTTMLGGGVGPWLVGGIADGAADHSDLALVCGLCLAIGVLMFTVARRLRY